MYERPWWVVNSTEPLPESSVSSSSTASGGGNSGSGGSSSLIQNLKTNLDLVRQEFHLSVAEQHGDPEKSDERRRQLQLLQSSKLGWAPGEKQESTKV